MEQTKTGRGRRDMRNGFPFIGYMAAVLTTFCGIPQIVRIVRLKESRDLSLWTPILLSIGILLWLIHGIMINDLPVIAANLVSLFLCITMVWLVVKYRS
jgi:MtN3 and saliva related transmembrane protein